MKRGRTFIKIIGTGNEWRIASCRAGNTASVFEGSVAAGLDFQVAEVILFV